MRTDRERDHELNQREQDHKSNLKVVCELCGSKTTAKNPVSHRRTPKCQKVSSGRHATSKDPVDKLEQVVGKLSLQKADLVTVLCESDVTTSAEWGFVFLSFNKII